MLRLLRRIRWPHALKGEVPFTRALADTLHRELQVAPENESVVAARTQVDIHFRRHGREWFITVKLGFTNQQRLTLQGELEDIFRDCADRRVKKSALVILIGLRDERRREIDVQIEALERCLATWVRRRSIDCEIIRVPMLPISEDALLEPEDAEASHRRPTFIEKLDLPFRWALFWRRASGIYLAYLRESRSAIIVFLAGVGLIGLGLAIAPEDKPAPAADTEYVRCYAEPKGIYEPGGQTIICPPAPALGGHAVDAGGQ